MKISLAFTDLSVIEEVPLPLWRELFDAVGWLESLRSRGDSMTHDEIVLAFQQDTPSDELLQALETLHNLGTPEGRDAISILLVDRQVSPTVLPQGLGERELALRLFLAQRTNGALAEIFSRAQVQLQEGNNRRFNDFIGKKPKTVRDPLKKGQELEAAIRDHCQQSDLGDHVQVRFFDDDDGAYRFQIMRSHHTRTPLAVTKASAARAKIEYRPVHADFLRYEPALGRLRITARAASIVECYRKVFGRVMFGDETFFYGPNVCNLNILQEKGSAALKHDVYGVGRIRMTECIWERGEEKLSFSSINCFDSIERLGIPLSEGQFLQAKFKIEVAGKSTRPVTVKVRVPSRIEVSQVHHESLINKVLESIGIRNAGASSSLGEYNLWTLYPWRQPVGTWRDCFGANTDALVGKGVLTKTQLTSIEPPAHPGAGRILHVEPVSHVEFLGVSQTPEIPSQSLSSTDLDGLEFSVPAFQRYLRGIFGITGNYNAWSDGNWCLDLGVLSIGEAQLRIFYALQQPPRDAAEDVRKISGSIRPILLLPSSGLKDSTGLTEILLDTAIPDRQRTVQDIIAVSDLTAQAPALCMAPVNARLIVDARFGKVWFEGVEISGLVPGTQAFNFIEIMARNFPAAVNMHDITAQISPGRTDDNQAARAAKMDATRLIKSTLKAEGKCFEDPFKAERGFYRLTVLAYHSETATSSLITSIA
jgi:hypothetical protein